MQNKQINAYENIANVDPDLIWASLTGGEIKLYVDLFYTTPASLCRSSDQQNKDPEFMRLLMIRNEGTLHFLWQPYSFLLVLP